MILIYINDIKMSWGVHGMHYTMPAMTSYCYIESKFQSIFERSSDEIVCNIVINNNKFVKFNSINENRILINKYIFKMFKILFYFLILLLLLII